MKQEFILIIDKIESHTCKSHGERASIKIVDDNIEISCCCNEFKKHLDRKIEYEFYKEFAREDIKVMSVDKKVA